MWNGRDRADQQVASGVYFYEIRAGEFSAVDKLVMIQ